MTVRRLSRRTFLTRRPELPPQPADFLVRVHRQIMACRVEVVLPGEHASLLPLASAALNEGDRLEEVMTIFRDSSELSRVNRDAHLEPVKVSHDLWSVLDLARLVSDATEGAFDPAATPLSRCWGFIQRQGRLPSREQIEAARECCGMRLVDLDPATRSVGFKTRGVSLNLGAIGKGFALDRMAAFLAERGATDALLTAGASSILAQGGTRTPWVVDVRSMVADRVLARLELVNAAVGTSGTGEQFFEAGGQRYGHVIDPRTGWPASGVLSASVVTRNAAEADALSTAFLIGGITLAERYCDQHADVLAIVTPDDEERVPVTVGSYPGATVHPL
jgi:thiamine biosynthesis lipoprotein